MTTTKFSWWNWFYNPTATTTATTDEESTEVARKITISKTPEEKFEALREEMYAAMRTELGRMREELEQHVEALIEGYTAPEVVKAEVLSKEVDSVNPRDYKKILQRLKSYGWNSREIADSLNARLDSIYQVSDSGIRACWANSYQNKPRNAHVIVPVAKQILEEVEHGKQPFELPPKPEVENLPPKPEIQGDYKRIRWILLRLERRFSAPEIQRHVNLKVKQYGEPTFSQSTIIALRTRTYQVHKDRKQWYPVAKAERLPTLIYLTHQLLTSKEQTQYNEMFGKPESR